MERGEIARLTHALYRVTERMDNREPLKWYLREDALTLDKLFSRTGEAFSYHDEERMINAFSNIISSLELASSMSYAAKVNFDVLMREYLSLQEKSEKENTAENLPAKIHHTPSAERTPIPESTSHGRGETNSVALIVEKNEGQPDRQRKILARLGSGNSTSIGELMQIFGSHVSEKTIQRDLNNLMIQGFIKAEGDKRWRKYSIISS